jgi:hypothetical protein
VDGPSTRLRLRVSPGARRSGIVGRHGKAWKVRVAAAPEDGKANGTLLALLAKTLGVPRRSLELTTGTASRDKIVTLYGLSANEANERLEASVGVTHASPQRVGAE